MTRNHQIQAAEQRPADVLRAALIGPLQHPLAAIGGAIMRYRTRRAVAALPPERLRDCGIDPSLSRAESISPDEARRMLSLMSMR